MQEYFNVSNSIDIDSSAISHTVAICSDPTHYIIESCITNTVSTSLCRDGFCHLTFEDLSSLPSIKDSTQQIAVRAFSSNILGDGLVTNATVVGILLLDLCMKCSWLYVIVPVFFVCFFCTDTTNMFFYVKFESSNSSFSCHFVGYYGTTTCTVTYEWKASESTNQNPSEKYQVENSSSDPFVTVTAPNLRPQTTSELTLYFVAVGTVTNLTVAVEGTLILTGIYNIIRTISGYNIMDHY